MPETHINKTNGDLLQILKEFDTVFLVDDSISMVMPGYEGESLWEQARKALTELAVVAAKYDTDGIEIHFLNSSIHRKGVTDGHAIDDLFNDINPFGISPIGRRLKELLTDYLERAAQARKKTVTHEIETPLGKLPTMEIRNVKPVNFIVITDGCASEEETDPQSPETVIKRAAKALHMVSAPMSQVGIQFVQIGESEGATEFLRHLDDDLEDFKGGIRDMVDATSCKPGVQLDLVKVLLGAIERKIDKQGSASVW